MERPIEFASGVERLEGLISRPSERARVGIVVCHPHPLYGGEMHNNVVTALVGAFSAAGMATLRFNFRGVGASSGTHDEGRGEQGDVAAAVACLASEAAPAAIAVAGYSFGAFVGLEAGARDPRVAALVGVALPVARRDVACLRTVEKPTLLVSGDRDDISPIAKLEQHVAGRQPHIGLAIVRGADHFFGGFEREVGDIAERFVRDTLDGGRG